MLKLKNTGIIEVLQVSPVLFPGKVENVGK